MQRMAVKDVMKLKHRQTIKRGSPLALSLAAAPEEEEEEEVLGNPSPSLLLAILLSVLSRKIPLEKMKEKSVMVRAGEWSINYDQNYVFQTFNIFAMPPSSTGDSSPAVPRQVVGQYAYVSVIHFFLRHVFHLGLMLSSFENNIF